MVYKIGKKIHYQLKTLVVLKPPPCSLSNRSNISLLVSLYSSHRSACYLIYFKKNSLKAHLNCIALWSLWCIRNKMIFENASASAAWTTNVIKTELTRLVKLHKRSFSAARFSHVWLSHSTASSVVRLQNDFF